jgi:hypothetical protein
MYGPLDVISMIVKRLISKTGWILEDLSWVFAKPFYQNKKKSSLSIPFTIGITTFLNRYENCFKVLINKVTVLFPECQIVVVANGHVKKEEQKIFLKSIKHYCKQFSNVQIISFIEPKGLSFIWNRIIEASEFKKILILNDDLKIKKTFKKFMLGSGILNADIAVINKSWSHYFLTKDLFNVIGSFDEGLLEIGGEDDDYSARITIKRKTIKHFRTTTIAGKLKPGQKRLNINSYGKDMNKERYGYSTYNNTYLENKWLMSNEPFEGATEVPGRFMRYWKLRTNSSLNKGV